MKGKHFSILREVFSPQPIFVSEKIQNVSLATLDDEFATVLKAEELIKKL